MKKASIRLVASLACMFVFSGIGAARPTFAATLTVTTVADEVVDDGQCSLREALAAANDDISVDSCGTGGGSDTITFDSQLTAGGPATVALTQSGGNNNPHDIGTSALQVMSSVSIVGPGGTNGITLARNDASAFRLVYVANGASLTLQNLTLQNGLAQGVNDQSAGGAVLNDGKLVIVKSTLRDNSALASDESDGRGGAIFNRGTLAITNSTLANNAAQASGTGNGLGGAIFNLDGEATLQSSTVAGNTVAGNNPSGGAVYQQQTEGSAVLNLDSSILADSAPGNDVFVNGGTVNGSASNIIEMNAAEPNNAPAALIITSADPQLGALAANGGPTATRKPGSASPARNALAPGTAGCGNPVTVDQRGAGRVLGNCDVGAVEVQTVSLSVSPAAAAEDGATNLVFTFARSDSFGALTVPFSIGGTASYASDYTVSGASSFDGASGSVGFADGQANVTVTIDPTADTALETDESVILTILDGDYTLGPSYTATGTILDDDTPVVSLSVSPAGVAEDGTTNLIYTFARTKTSGSLLVSFAVSGTATLNTDYVVSGASAFDSTSGSILFSSGLSKVSIVVNSNVDVVIEPDETLVLSVVDGSSYRAGTVYAVTGTILDDDATPANVTISSAPEKVTEDGNTNLQFTFTRQSTGNSLIVPFTIGGTALLGSDYAQTGASNVTTTSGRVVFATGQSTVVVTVNPTTDTTIEPDETVIFTLTSNLASASGTIVDDDTPTVSITVSPASVSEDGSQKLIFSVSRTVSVNPLTVAFTVGGTATYSVDYTQTGATTFNGTTGTITLASNQISGAVSVKASADTVVESDETVQIQIVSGSGYVLGTTSATGTILNDDQTATPTPTQTPTEKVYKSLLPLVMR